MRWTTASRSSSIPVPALALTMENIFLAAPQEIHDLVSDRIGHGSGEIDLVQHRNDLQPGLDGKKEVGDRLGFHSLGSVHNQNRPLAGCQRARNLIGKIYMPGGVDQVQQVGPAVSGQIVHLNGMEFDGDAAFLLEVHVVQDLIELHLARCNRPGPFEQAVGQRRLPVVNVCDDAEVANLIHWRR